MCITMAHVARQPAHASLTQLGWQCRRHDVLAGACKSGVPAVEGVQRAAAGDAKVAHAAAYAAVAFVVCTHSIACKQ